MGHRVMLKRTRSLGAIWEQISLQLRHRVTKRLRKRITIKALKKAAKELGKHSLSDRIHKVTPSRNKSRLAAKIWIKDGRALTEFVLVDGEWQADTLWFR